MEREGKRDAWVFPSSHPALVHQCLPLAERAGKSESGELGNVLPGHTEQ